MIDENLPVFYYKASKEKQDATIYLAQYGNEATPAYTLKHPDPASPDARNRYAAALYDCYNPEILFAEVLVIPEWAQTTPSADELRRNNGVPPRPEPTMPRTCTIQLYNPDQQIVIEHTPSKWNASETWDFDVPQQTFRQPSASALDRGQNDPAALEATPTIPLRWKREGKLSKDLTCFLSGRSRNPDGSKKKHKEPDIPIAFFKNLREITVYEPNLNRVDIEDPKGFEVTLLLGATLIRDVYHGSLAQAFNLSENPQRRGSNEPKPAYAPPPPAMLSKPPSNTPNPPIAPAAAAAAAAAAPSPSFAPPPPTAYAAVPPAPAGRGAPPTDPRTQWEIDAETARLRAASEAEAKNTARQRRKDDKKSEKAAAKLAEEEQRAARARQAAIDAETKRLQQAYAAEQRRLLSPPLPPLPPRRSSDVGPRPAPPLPPRSPDGRTGHKERLSKKDQSSKKDRHGKQNAVPSVPSASFLQAPAAMGASWLPGQVGPHRPASATGFFGGGGGGGSTNYAPPPAQRPATAWRPDTASPAWQGGLRPPGPPPAPPGSGSLLGNLLGHGRHRSTSDLR